MKWNDDHRYDLCNIIQAKNDRICAGHRHLPEDLQARRTDCPERMKAVKASHLAADAEWESFKKSLGIEVMDLKNLVAEAPQGTVAVWFETIDQFQDSERKRCWIVPDDSALKILVLGVP